MKDSNEIEKLMQLKKYETPGEDYFAKFAENFKERQRADMLRHSSLTLLTERSTLWLQELGNAKWLVPAGIGVAALVVVSLSVTPDSGNNSSAITAGNQGPETPESITFEFDLPHPGDRVPGNPDRRFSGSPGKLNTSLSGGRREL